MMDKKQISPEDFYKAMDEFKAEHPHFETKVDEATGLVHLGHLQGGISVMVHPDKCMEIQDGVRNYFSSRDHLALLGDEQKEKP